ncbi:MAG: replicative DNA helicase, partial [Oscillospiraceae bacterium]|nr:replicative DNA helicase [Oscillospiraceae bacterium]
EGNENHDLRPINEILLETYEHLQKLSGENRDKYIGLSSGFSHLDNALTGLNKSDLIVLAARPGMGKTAFVLNIAQSVATKQKKAVAIFSLEMPSEQLVTRMLAALTLVNSYSFKTGRMKSDDWTKIASASSLLSQSPIYMDDTANMTVAEMKSKLRRVKDLGLVIIDYLQLMSGNIRTNNRVSEISEITRNIKIMAKELDVPVIVCSQLARGPDTRKEDHRPLLSDLRESGSIEQDADIVLFLYRDAYYNRETADASLAECIVAKNRHGETTTVPLTWDGQHTRFITREIVRDDTQV